MQKYARGILIGIVGGLLWNAAPTCGSERLSDNMGWLDARRDYGARGNGRDDDTADLRDALADCGQKAAQAHVTLFIPSGIYRVSDTLSCPPGVTLQGAGAEETQLFLAPSSTGFDDAHAAQPCLDFPGADADAPASSSTWNYLFDFTVSVGAGNPGAIGVRQGGPSSLAARGVTVRSGGDGYAALDIASPRALYSSWDSSRFLGFDRGIGADCRDGCIVCIDCEFANQRRAGIQNTGAAISLERVRSENAVPLIVNRQGGLVTVINSDLLGGDAETFGIDNQAVLHARNLKERGYRQTIRQTAPPESPLELAERSYKWGYLDEFLSVDPVGAFPQPLRPLKVPMEQPPVALRGDPDRDWISISDFAHEVVAGDWGPALQAAIDSGARTIYFPQDCDVVLGRPVIVRGNVVRLFGAHQALRSGRADTGPGSEAALIVDSEQQQVWIERLAVPHVTHRSATTLVIRDATLGGLDAESGCGALHLSNVVGPIRVASIQRVWARGLVIRPDADETALANDGGLLWVLGLQVAEAGLVVENRNAARTEILGGWIDPRPEPADVPLVFNLDAEIALTHSLSTRAGNVRPYAVENRRGQTATFRDYRWYGGRIVQQRYLSGPGTP